MDPEPADLVTHIEAAKLLKLHPNVLHRWRARGRLPHYRRGGRYFYARTDLLRLFERVEGENALPPTQAERERRAAAATAQMMARRALEKVARTSNKETS